MAPKLASLGLVILDISSHFILDPCLYLFLIEYRSVTSQKNEFVKLWDLVPFSNIASLKKGPCQKLPLNCNSQMK